MYMGMCDSAQMVTEQTVHLYTLTHPRLPISPYICILVNCCLHLLSLQNGLTALEVATASDKDWEKYMRYKVVHDYDGVVDLLSGYTAEPAVSGTITTSSH